MSLLQIKVTLAGTRPPVWRRLALPPDIKLGELHRVIQTAMGWKDCHLHRFVLDGEQYSDPSFDFDGDILDERKTRLRSLLIEPGSRLIYEYDFGDGWVHELYREEDADEWRDKGSAICIDGARACPPEDCGGPEAYGDLVRVLKQPKNKSHKATREWLVGDFDPETFDREKTDQRLVRLVRKKR